MGTLAETNEPQLGTWESERRHVRCRVAHLNLKLAVGYVAADAHGGSWGMLSRVGERLLNRAVDRALGGSWQILR